MNIPPGFWDNSQCEALSAMKCGRKKPDFAEYQEIRADKFHQEENNNGGASTLARNKNYYKPQKCGLFYVKFYLFLCCTELYFIFICDIMRYETQL